MRHYRLVIVSMAREDIDRFARDSVRRSTYIRAVQFGLTSICETSPVSVFRAYAHRRKIAGL